MSRNDFDNQQEGGEPESHRPPPRMRGLLGWVLIGGLIVLVVRLGVIACSIPGAAALVAPARPGTSPARTGGQG